MPVYRKPQLRHLGRMDEVTRKSGNLDDPGGEPNDWTWGDWQGLCEVWPNLPWCNNANLTGSF